MWFKYFISLSLSHYEINVLISVSSVYDDMPFD